LVRNGTLEVMYRRERGEMRGGIARKEGREELGGGKESGVRGIMESGGGGGGWGGGVRGLGEGHCKGENGRVEGVVKRRLGGLLENVKNVVKGSGWGPKCIF